ncbi:Der1-like family-domain-containing protein [Chiua virens]|nr:Der1-like family-domain-containing protein [Chiua virens]
MAEIVAELKKIPSVTRFLVLSSLGVSVPAILGFVHPHRLVFLTPLVTQQWEIWRIYTSLFFGGWSILFFNRSSSSRNSNSIEYTYYERRSSDYAWQLFLASMGIIALNRPFGSVVHDHAFLCCITYLMCALSPPGAQTSIMGFITIPVKYFSYALLAIDVINGRAFENITGMIVGHLWWWCVWGAGTGAGGLEHGPFASLGSAPGWLRDWFGERAGDRRATNRGGYQVHPPRERAEQAARGTGHNWGSGQRLGDQ